MSRPLSVDFDGALYHVTSPGNAREYIFEEDGDRKAFLEILGKDERYPPLEPTVRFSEK